MATAIPKACLASSAIRCRDVETGPTLGVLAVVPSNGATCRCPLPSTGPEDRTMSDSYEFATHIFRKVDTMSRMSQTRPARRVRRQFNDEFKAEAIRLVLEEGKTVGAVIRRSARSARRRSSDKSLRSFGGTLSASNSPPPCMMGRPPSACRLATTVEEMKVDRRN